jgi:hypothetical protein
LKYFSPNTNYDALERELTHAEQNEAMEKWPEYSHVGDDTEQGNN